MLQVVAGSSSVVAVKYLNLVDVFKCLILSKQQSKDTRDVSALWWTNSVTVSVNVFPSSSFYAHFQFEHKKTSLNDGSVLFFLIYVNSVSCCLKCKSRVDKNQM